MGRVSKRAAAQFVVVARHVIEGLDCAELAEATRHARRRSLALIADLDDEQLRHGIPRHADLNPLLWEVGHVAWFQERWVLRRNGSPSGIDRADDLYDSTRTPHLVRWDLPLPDRARTLEYLADVETRVLERLLQVQGGAPDELYHQAYAMFHEDMHAEAFTVTRQWCGYPPPAFAPGARENAGAWPGDVEVPGGAFQLGATREEGFVFDNEKWAHTVKVPSFRIARAAVTQAEFAHFVDSGGYEDDGPWSEAGRGWRAALGSKHPGYWRHSESGWLRRHFDRWVSLEPHRPAACISYYEAEAFCAYAGRRVPTETEWEMAASLDPSTGRKNFHPWGFQPARAEHANLVCTSDGAGSADTVDVAVHATGDSAVCCRQMAGNVWEWTSDWFEPYPGFSPDMYREYSWPWFYDHKVLRGGSSATTARLLRNTWRNYARPFRRDLFTGFRTCASS